MDCTKGMKEFPDKYFELAIVDPPYGIGHSLLSGNKRGSKFTKDVDNVKWDVVPNKIYFDELFRVSINQIIWGGNYFINYLQSTRCFLMWDKVQEFSGSDFELAWTSFNQPSKSFRLSRVEAYTNGTSHPTQKPIRLYKWILGKYANPGDKILDTHVGSASSLIAFEGEGYEYVGYELDKDYYDAAQKRLENFRKQLKMEFVAH